MTTSELAAQPTDKEILRVTHDPIKASQAHK